MTRWAVEANVVDEPADVAELWRRIAGEWRAAGDLVHEASALLDCARSVWSTGDSPASRRLTRQAVSMLETCPAGPELAMGYARLAGQSMLAREVPEALEWGRRAITLAEEVDAPRALAAALNAVGAASIVGEVDVERGIADLRRSHEIALSVGDDVAAVLALSNIGTALGEIRRYAAAEPALRESVAFARARDLDDTTGYGSAWLARVLFETGHWDEATQARRRRAQAAAHDRDHRDHGPHRAGPGARPPRGGRVCRAARRGDPVGRADRRPPATVAGGGRAGRGAVARLAAPARSRRSWATCSPGPSASASAGQSASWPSGTAAPRPPRAGPGSPAAALHTTRLSRHPSGSSWPATTSPPRRPGPSSAVPTSRPSASPRATRTRSAPPSPSSTPSGRARPPTGCGDGCARLGSPAYLRGRGPPRGQRPRSSPLASSRCSPSWPRGGPTPASPSGCSSRRRRPGTTSPPCSTSSASPPVVRRLPSARRMGIADTR